MLFGVPYAGANTYIADGGARLNGGEALAARAERQTGRRGRRDVDGEREAELGGRIEEGGEKGDKSGGRERR